MAITSERCCCKSCGTVQDAQPTETTTFMVVFLVADLSLWENQFGIALHGGNCRRVARSLS